DVAVETGEKPTLSVSRSSVGSVLKLVPLTVSAEPACTIEGVKPVIVGGALFVAATVNVTPLLDVLFTVTTTGPVVAPDGTVATMLVLLQLVAIALVPLNATVLAHCVAPKPLP